MTAAEFRRIALSMPQATEAAHMAHPDFRVDGKIFVTLGYPGKNHGMVILPPEEQKRLVESDYAAFAPAKGAWGLRGSTCVRLEAVECADVGTRHGDRMAQESTEAAPQAINIRAGKNAVAAPLCRGVGNAEQTRRHSAVATAER
jgi:hypothetical protein